MTFEDFATLGTYLHILSQRTYNQLLSFVERVKELR